MHHTLGDVDRPSLVLGPLALVDEHHVEVARHVQLAGAELAHPDHREGEVGRGFLDGLAHHALRHRREGGAGLTREQLATRVPRDRGHERRLDVALGVALGERQDALGLRREQVRGERARRHGVGEPARHTGVGGERVGGRIKLPHRVGHAFQADEGGVGVGRQRQSRRHHREDVREHLPHPGRGIDEAPEHLVRPARVREAEASQQLLRRRAVHARGGRRRSGERLHQGTVEEAVVDAAHGAGGALVLGLEGGGIGEAERARDRGARVQVGGKVVGLEVAHDLEPVLQAAQEAVGVGEHLGVDPRDVALLRQGAQGAQRVGVAQPRIAPAVHDLQELDGELDVADPPASPLHLDELLAPPADVLLQTDLRAAHLVDRVSRELARIHERRHPFHEGAAEPRVPGRRARLDHRLALPDRGARLVVLERALQREAEQARAAAGAQRRVHAQRDALDRGVGEQPHEAPRRALGRLLVGAPFVHEEDVDVAGVVELPAAELAERDHGQAQVPGGLSAGELQTGVGHRGDLGHDVLEVAALQVARGHAEQGAAPEEAEAVGGSAPRHVVGQFGAERLAPARGDVGERADLLRMLCQEVGGRRREAEEPGGGGRDVEGVHVAAGLAHPLERHARQRGIGGAGEGVGIHSCEPTGGVPRGRSSCSPLFEARRRSSHARNRCRP